MSDGPRIQPIAPESTKECRAAWVVTPVPTRFDMGLRMINVIANLTLLT